MKARALPAASSAISWALSSKTVSNPGLESGDAEFSMARHSRSFSWAARLLPVAERDSVKVLYAWCRRADEAVDASEAGAKERLRGLQVELRRAYSRVRYTGERPIELVTTAEAQQLMAVIERHQLPAHYLQELLRGMMMDAETRRYDTLQDLIEYCYCVAGTVGLMLCHVLGVTSRAALNPAAHLGIAMQLTNICRDVAEDESRGRCYLPSDLRRGRVEAEVVLELLRLADRYYASADLGMRYLPWRGALGVWAARVIYADIARIIRKRGGNVRLGRAVVSAPRKLWLVLRAVAAWLGDGIGRIGRKRDAEAPMRVLKVTQLSQPGQVNA